ncbi:MAG: N-acetyltransferase family protein, partial [Chitinophagaceae bacterium]
MSEIANYPNFPDNLRAAFIFAITFKLSLTNPQFLFAFPIVQKEINCRMKVQLRDGRIVSIRPLQTSDKEPLYHYLQNLSAESRSRFGPHPFDEQTIEMICEDPGTDTLRFIAVGESAPEIIAYMLIKQGMIEADQRRYAMRSQFFNDSITVTCAPSVADAWQSSGLGTAMLNSIEAELINKGIRYIILWGGVQASNLKA